MAELGSTVVSGDIVVTGDVYKGGKKATTIQISYGGSVLLNASKIVIDYSNGILSIVTSVDADN